MHIKICGITNTKDALQAVQAGASHLGIIFVENSPSCAKVEEAQAIVKAVDKKAIVVGVFQNKSIEDIARIAVETGIDAIQLHGDEDAAFCRSIGLRLGKPVIKTIVVTAGDNDATAQKSLLDKIAPYRSEEVQVDYLLFDRAKGEPNQEWLSSALTQLQTMEKEEAKRAKRDPKKEAKEEEENKKHVPLPPYFFAGGLNLDNIAHVIDTINPFSVDVASGVEASAGQKDPALVSAFIASVKGEGK